MLSRLHPIWPLIAGFASAALLAGAHAFQRFGGLQPCPLCLDQREWHWGVLGFAALSYAVMRWKPAYARWAAIGLGLILLGSAAQGAFHVAVEQGWVIYRCEANIDLDNLAFDVNAPVEVPQCDKVLWSLFGISMAGYNAIISFILGLAPFAVALAPERKA
ncbi:MAG TPA: disulfide bond formation protein B [Terricaulis sp.]|nr:disulfide bond formation protein B [Terricaulis sp.]